ncbi:hypothetical protein CDD81_7376 [Ophiocordyceps australis]|uniref:Ribonucleases P/MRP subunit Pop8-like domain-containing protein n=1 Tax=Ophiocordyceps australis TaxID=1399860 RepID=A0A2C5Y4L9_9HYPO|nr:hypothetical protein CDD81_7376 [Ophiocordyceps australis]
MSPQLSSGRFSSSPSHEILTCTIKQPLFSYAHLELLSESGTPPPLDNLQVKAYCSAALRQFLGLSGAAVSIDILAIHGAECWIRVPYDCLGSFAAALTAWRGTLEDGSQCVLRVKRCSNWLGTMVGAEGQERLWHS